MSRSTFDPAVSTVALNDLGAEAIMSMVWVPIEPVDPSIAIFFKSEVWGRAMIGYLSAKLHQSFHSHLIIGLKLA